VDWPQAPASTQVNGKAVDMVNLEKGDKLRVGNSHFSELVS